MHDNDVANAEDDVNGVDVHMRGNLRKWRRE